MSKVCSKCKIEKELSEFQKAPQCKFGVRPDCKICNYELYKIRHAKFKALHPDQKRKTIRKYKYKITDEQYQEMLKNQNFVCKICKKPETCLGKNGTLSVDHCHTTGKVRGLLCHACNAGIGFFKEDKESLLKAVLYLEKS